MEIKRASAFAASLIAMVAIAVAHAQTPPAPTTEAQARYWVYGAFLTQAVPQIMAERVTLGPELERTLGVRSGDDPATIYKALVSLTDQKQIRVRKATADEVSKYAAQSRRQLADPLFTLQAGDIRLLVQYDLQANTIPFVGALASVAAVEAPQPKPTLVERPAPSPVSAPAPAPVIAPAAVSVPAPVAAPAAVVVPAAVVAPKPAPVLAPKPAPVRVATPAPVVMVPPKPAVVVEKPRPAPIVARPAPAVVAPAPLPKPTGPCEVKPVMTDQDLINCGVRPQ